MSTRHTERRKRTALRWGVIGLTLLFFLTPLYGMLEFTTRDLINGGRTAKVWTTLVDVNQVTDRYPALAEGFAASLALAVFTVVVMLALLVPTMTWVRLRLPGLTRTVEFICLLPLTVPAIVLVVGLTPIYAWVNYLLGALTLLLITGSFWIYARMTVGVAYDYVFSKTVDPWRPGGPWSSGRRSRDPVPAGP